MPDPDGFSLFFPQIYPYWGLQAAQHLAHQFQSLQQCPLSAADSPHPAAPAPHRRPPQTGQGGLHVPFSVLPWWLLCHPTGFWVPPGGLLCHSWLAVVSLSDFCASPKRAFVSHQGGFSVPLRRLLGPLCAFCRLDMAFVYPWVAFWSLLRGFCLPVLTFGSLQRGLCPSHVAFGSPGCLLFPWCCFCAPQGGFWVP